jgi:hypothetical protein
MKLNLTSFPFHPKDLNFSANRGNSATKSQELIIGKAIIKYLELKIVSAQSGPLCKTKGIEIIKRAFAGVGTPIKESVCLVSRLNLASRTAENIGIRNGK